MAEKLKIIPLGGLGEVGKNLTVYEIAGEILLVDCGMGFPDVDLLGVDMVIPDISYLMKHKNRIRGVVITHGHEDHIGALPFLLRDINIPVYCTRLTSGLIEIKLEEHNLLDTVKIHTIEAGDSFKVGAFGVEAVRVNHSIADAVSIVIDTPLGKIIHTGDFKIDTTPVEGDVIDLGRFGQLGKDGVLLLLSDSTNAERPGYAMSERKVGQSLDALFRGCESRIIITTFASNVHRLQQIINAAVKHGRRVAITGRSMENILKIAIKHGYMNIPDGTLVDLPHVKSLPADKVVIVTTGSQGEPMSGLYRMAFSGHRQVEVCARDRVIISASPIPGNEKTISRVINELLRKGAEVIYEKLADIHVSGHACAEELKIMLALTRPTYFMPLHGEYRHLKAHAGLARQAGVPAQNIFLGENGRVLEITAKGAKWVGNVPSGRVLVDGLGVGDVGNVVLRDRKHLAQDGLIVVVITLDADGGLLAGPDIVTRGFVYVKEAEVLMDEMRRHVLETLEACFAQNISDWATIKSSIRNDLSDFLFKKTKRSPMLLPVIMEV